MRVRDKSDSWLWPMKLSTSSAKGGDKKKTQVSGEINQRLLCSCMCCMYCTLMENYAGQLKFAEKSGLQQLYLAALGLKLGFKKCILWVPLKDYVSISNK